MGSGPVWRETLPAGAPGRAVVESAPQTIRCMKDVWVGEGPGCPPGSSFRAWLGKPVPPSELPPRGSDYEVLASSGEPPPPPPPGPLTSGRLDAHPRARTADPESVSGREGHGAAAGGQAGPGPHAGQSSARHGARRAAGTRPVPPEGGGRRASWRPVSTPSFKEEGGRRPRSPCPSGEQPGFEPQTRAGVGPGSLGELGLRGAGTCQGLWRGFQEKKDITNHGGSGKTVGGGPGQGWPRAGPKWPVLGASAGRLAGCRPRGRK